MTATPGSGRCRGTIRPIGIMSAAMIRPQANTACSAPAELAVLSSRKRGAADRAHQVAQRVVGSRPTRGEPRIQHAAERRGTDRLPDQAREIIQRGRAAAVAVTAFCTATVNTRL